MPNYTSYGSVVWKERLHDLCCSKLPPGLGNGEDEDGDDDDDDAESILNRCKD